jgi:hypothetical protein
MGSDLYFLQRDLDGRRLPILERMAREIKIAKREPFKSMLKQLDELEIK